MNSKNKLICIVFFLTSLLLIAKEVPGKMTFYQYNGRVEILKDSSVVLISPASSITFEFLDTNLEVFLQSADSYEHHNYVTFELDGVNLGRVRIEKGKVNSIPIKTTEKKAVHRLTIFKASEASVGNVIFSGSNANLQKFKPQKKKKVEFIGDSITCGFGNDTALYPCGTGEWYDQNNAYMAYGPQLARALDFDYVLSAVSGIGIYRNWNEEGVPAMPNVYGDLYLNSDEVKPYSFDFQPDLVSICLGTNDLSDGDGKKERKPFNEDQYVSNYIKFIKTVYTHAPKTRIILLTSPMISGNRNEILIKCLNRVIAAFANDKKHEPITLFQFESMKTNGCGSHPDIEDDTAMANQLNSIFKKLLHEN